jgi:hypothetical protein
VFSLEARNTKASRAYEDSQLLNAGERLHDPPHPHLILPISCSDGIVDFARSDDFVGPKRVAAAEAMISDDSRSNWPRIELGVRKGSRFLVTRVRQVPACVGFAPGRT